MKMKTAIRQDQWLSLKQGGSSKQAVDIVAGLPLSVIVRADTAAWYSNRELHVMRAYETGKFCKWIGENILT